MGRVAWPTNSVGGYQVDLSADGTADWAHWGLSSPASFDHKAGVPLLQQISNFTPIATSTIQALQDYVTEFTWSDGTPTGSAGPTRTGVFIHGLTNGFRITAPTDTSGRRLKVYVGLYGAEGKLQAYLSDHSAPAYTDTSLRSSPYGNDFAVYTLDYRAASSGQTLIVEYTASTLFDADYGNVSLEAATLSGANLPTNTPPTVSLSSPTNNASFTAGDNVTLQANANDSDGSVAQVEFFVGATLLGTATGSPYSFTWSAVPAGNYSLTAKATDNQGAAATSGAVSITVNPANVSPSVTIISPTIGAVLIAPATFTVQATASDSDGSVAQVEFFNETISLGIDSTSPYSASANNLAAGPYTLSAVATDNLGATATNSVNIVVDAPPTVTITSPTNSATFTAPANITITAAASDSDGPISKVEFFEGVIRLGETTNAPYSTVWSNVVSGSYLITAKATDEGGTVGTSIPVSITVNSNAAARVTLLNPLASGNRFSFSFSAESNRTYTVEHTTTLSPVNWQTLTNMVGNGNVLSAADAIQAETQQFYRVHAE